MVESVPDNAIHAKVPSEDSESNPVICGESATTPDPPNYPYLQLLQTLEDQNRSQSWDLASDALLATLLREFSSHVASRAHRVASEVRSVQNSVNGAGVDVAICQTELMKRHAEIFTEQRAGDDESESGTEAGEAPVDGDDEKAGESAEDDDSAADIARLEAEEKSAIADGMKALDLFFDPQRPDKSSGSSSGGEGVDGGADDAIIGENCYYYLAAEEDGFNQRPLPFIVGSREFMESMSCAGPGVDDGQNK